MQIERYPHVAGQKYIVGFDHFLKLKSIVFEIGKVCGLNQSPLEYGLTPKKFAFSKQILNQISYTTKPFVIDL